jgi:hypothetical protein
VKRRSHGHTNCYIFYQQGPILDVLNFQRNSHAAQMNCYRFERKCNNCAAAA